MNVERIVVIMTNSRRKIKLGFGSTRSNDETVKNITSSTILSPFGSFKLKGRFSQTSRRSQSGTGQAGEQDGRCARTGRQRSNIKVECLWIYRFILFLWRQNIKYCFNWKRPVQSGAFNELWTNKMYFWFDWDSEIIIKYFKIILRSSHSNCNKGDSNKINTA